MLPASSSNFSGQSNLDTSKNILIVTSDYTLVFANKIKDYINQYVLNVEIKTINNDIIKDNIIRNVINNKTALIIIGVTNIKNYEDLLYIKDKVLLIQTEQLNLIEFQFKSNKNKYIEFITSFKYLYDYNIQNEDLYYDKFKIINIPINYHIFYSEVKDIDVLFIGTLNPRRKKIIDYLTNKNINVKVVSKLFYNELADIIKKSKVIINIHIHEESIFEYFRINEILPYNTHVLSESVSNEKIIKDYENFIEFIPIIKDDLNNIDILVDKINILLNKQYVKNVNLDDFILNNNIKFNKQLEYFCRKVLNIKTDVVVNPSTINNTDEYKKKMLLKQEIEIQYNILNHIIQKLNETNATLDFEKNMNHKLYDEQKNIRILITKNEMKQGIIKNSIEDNTDKLRQIKNKLEKLIDDLNASDKVVDVYKKEYDELLKDEEPINKAYNKMLDKKNKIESIIQVNKVNINTLVNNNNETMQQAIDMQRSSLEFIRQAEEKAQRLLIETQKKRSDIEKMIIKSKNDNIEYQYLQNELTNILLQELTNSENIIYSKIDAEKDLAEKINLHKEKVKLINEEKNNIQDIIDSNKELLKNSIELDIEKYEQEKNYIKVLKNTAKTNLDVEVKKNLELYDNKKIQQELYDHINTEIIKNNNDLLHEVNQHSIYTEQLYNFEYQQIGIGNQINKSTSYTENTYREKHIAENKILELKEQASQIELDFKNKVEELQEEEFVNIISKISENNAISEKTNSISWGIKQNTLENTIEKRKQEILAARKTQQEKSIPEIKKYKKHPNLFNKYILNIEKEKAPEYSVVLKSKNKFGLLIAHLHCYDISEFYNIYGDYIENIEKFFSIIITYSIGKIKERIDHTLIKIPNKGMDIGGKICAINYLNKLKVNFTHILFLHSKNNVNSREKYFSFINKYNFATTLNKINGNYDGIFPNIIKNGDWDSNNFVINKTYVSEMLSYLNLVEVDNEFIEGNCMLLSKRIIDKIFSENINIFYNILNSENSFDINWVTWYYKLSKDYDYMKIYDVYNNNKLLGNNINNPSKINIPKEYDINNILVGYQLRDGMIEHAFERIYLNVIKNFNGNYYIVE